MRMRYITTALIAAGGLTALTLLEKDSAEKTEGSDYDTLQLQPNEVSKITASPVYATVKYNGALYSDESLTKPTDYLKAGDRVEIIKDKAGEVYYIRHNSRLGWTRGDILSIPVSPKTVTEQLTKEEIEAYARDMRFKSDTDYFVWVDIARQRTYVLKYDEKGVLRLEKSIICATGKNESPTVRGYFVISDRGESFYNARLGSGAKYWVRFNGSYLFHSIALNQDGSVKDATLGVRRSDGCVRMGMDDIKWFYENIPQNTSVRVN